MFATFDNSLLLLILAISCLNERYVFDFDYAYNSEIFQVLLTTTTTTTTTTASRVNNKTK